MVRFVRTARFLSGKGQQAMQFAKEIVEWDRTKFGIQASVYIDLFGEQGIVRWFMDFDSLAAFEQFGEKVMADQEYWQRVSKVPDLFIEGSITDMVMRSF